jgi:hypothetical protein
MAFQKAVKTESKMRVAIMGPSGAGKTYTALNIAKHMPNARIALVDTEHGSASKYADIFDFDVMELQPPYHPDRFGEAIRDAAQAGYTVIILDSLTHAWSGTGGMLDLVDQIGKRIGGNSFAAWKDATPIQNRLIESIVGAPIHVIATMRSKQDYAQEKDDRGKTVVRKVGMAAQQREGFEYEFDVVIDLDIDHNGIITKSRAPVLADKVIAKPGREVADMLTDWLKGASAPTNGQVQDDKPATNGRKAQPKQPEPEPLDDNLVKQFHATGTELYGDAWDDKRPALVRSVTGKRTASSNELTEDEMLRLIEGMNDKLRANAEAQPELLATPHKYQ